MKSPYEVLGVAKTATDDEIKKAYRKGAKKFHPDSNSEPGAVDKFKEIQEAYEILSDPVKKSQFDGGAYHMHNRRRGSTPQNPFQQSPFQDVMSEFFGGSTYKGRNITIRIEIEFNELLTGCTKPVQIKKRKRCTGCDGHGFTGFVNCNVCSGSGFVQVADAPFEFKTGCQVCGGTGKSSTVKCGDCIGSGYLPGYQEKALNIQIPAGIESGMQLRIPGEGEDSVQALGRAGDVVVFILVKEHSLFTREGMNLNIEVPVSYTQLVLGSQIEIPTLNEGVLTVKVPEGSQSHTKFRLKGKGLPSMAGTGIGDLIATLKVEIPKMPNEEYKKVLDQLNELENKNITPRREQWTKKVNGNKG